MIKVALLAAIAGGLVVYLFYAARPQPLDEPRDILGGGVTLLQVTGYGPGVRVRVLLALASLCACLFFLAGYLADA